MFAKAIREERSNLSVNMFATVINATPGSVKAWESGRLPRTQVFNRLAKEFGWSKTKASQIAKWIEDERKQQKNEAKHERIKASAFDQISEVVLGTGSLSDIDLIVNETLEVIEEDSNG